MSLSVCVSSCNGSVIDQLLGFYGSRTITSTLKLRQQKNMQLRKTGLTLEGFHGIMQHASTVGNHVTFYTYIRTERVSIFVIISLMLNDFSYRKAQIPHRFCS